MKKLWGRDRSQDIVTDLDALLSEPVPFKFNGKIHTLKPMGLDEFLKYTNAQFEFRSGYENDKSIKEDFAKRFHAVLSSVCETITLDDVMHMTQPQIAALYQLVIDMVCGQVDQGDGKKKRKRIDIYESVGPSSSRNAESSLDGQPKRH